MFFEFSVTKLAVQPNTERTLNAESREAEAFGELSKGGWCSSTTATLSFGNDDFHLIFFFRFESLRRCQRLLRIIKPASNAAFRV